VEEQTGATREIARTIEMVALATRRVAALMQDVQQVTDGAGGIARAVNGSADRMREGLEALPPLLGRAIRMAVAEADRRGDRRRPLLLETTLRTEAGSVPGLLRDLSESGFFVETTAETAPGGVPGGTPGTAPGAPVRVDLPERPNVAGTVIAQAGTGLHVALATPLDTAFVNRIARESAERIARLAVEDHRLFVGKVAEAVASGGGLTAADLATHHSCRLGRWYDAVSDRTTRDLPAFQAIDHPHGAVHREGRSALLALAGGDRAAAERHVAAMKRASAEVVTALGQLPGELRQTLA
jgi:hypothetical protein